MRELGGLYVLGTERHESRRIDNQLRGRCRPPGRRGREPLLPLARRRADAPVRDRAHVARDERVVPRRHAARVEDGLEGRRARAGNGRGPQLRDPQERAQVRRGDERAAQGHLQAPPADPRRRGPRRGGDPRDRVRDQPPRRAVLPRRVLRGLGRPRPARRGAALLPDAHHQGADRRGHRARGARGDVRRRRHEPLRRRRARRSAPRPCATSSAG